MKNVLKVLAFAVGYVLAYLIVLFVLLYAADFFESNFRFPHADLLAFIFGNVLMIGLLIYFRHRNREIWIREEAEKWLAERSRHATRVQPWCTRLRRYALLIPSGLVLMISLFLPEIAGLASHLFCGRSVHLNQYELKTPWTWIVARSSNSSAWFIAGKGIGRVGLHPYWRKEAPVSEIVVYVTADSSPLSDWYLAHARVLSKPTFQLGQEKLICWDIVPYADTRLIAMNPRFAEILCSSDQNDFHANFVGRRNDSLAFYKVLQGATPNEVKP